MTSLDTNIVLRYLLDDIPEQTEKARNIIAKSPCYVTDVVLTEIVYVLERVIEMERADIARLVKAFLSLPNLIYNDYFLDEAIDLYAVKGSLSFVDCYASTEAKVYNNKLVTFDKALAKQGGSHISEL
ncbi:PilT protein domain protein [candidate division TM7 genomosp. GTL1]|nr:PilT protein domain protein [candidate division TM7 genomosp. GTL1]